MKRWPHLNRDKGGGDKSRDWKSPQYRFSLVSRLKQLLLAFVMAGLWYFAGPSVMSSDEQALWEKVRAAQTHIFRLRQENGTSALEEDDSWQCGLIGVEWSGITTTLGDLSSKRTACNPAWAIQYSRWFRELGLDEGDHIAIYSSASFPGLLVSALVAAEAMDLEPLLIVSLGASTWGANHMDSPWPVIATELRRGGFIRHRADYYTLGGDGESGLDLAPEAASLLRAAANTAGVELLTTGKLEDMVARKSELLEQHQSRLLLSIGGSHANLGDAPEVLRMQTGLILPGNDEFTGNGVIGVALRGDIPVIHMLNIRSLSALAGIPYDRQPRKMAPAKVSAWWSGIGVLVFFTVILRHRRWKLEPEK
ncbi:MAG: poly-gamma-glutamate system protein [Gammaproteobacteria bacterium]|nr:poly-gamma-glutamate system protein [Gammaproteobacteria bacterium]